MSIKSTKYLYNIDPAILADMPYKQALEYKITAAKQLISTLLEPHYYARDDEHINAVHKSIKFNEQLLKELLCK